MHGWTFWISLWQDWLAANWTLIWVTGFSSVDLRSDGFLLRALQGGRAIGGRRVRRGGNSCGWVTAHTTLRDIKSMLEMFSELQINVWVWANSLTCVSISCGMVWRLIQGWTSASSSLCSLLNHGWRGWSTLSFSLSSANTSFWSLEKQKHYANQEKFSVFCFNHLLNLLLFVKPAMTTTLRSEESER